MVAGVALALAVGCRATGNENYKVPETPMPANTVLLTEMMRELSAQPGFTDHLMEQMQKGLGGHRGAGAALLTPDLMEHMKNLIVGREWQKLDRFPGWTMREINPTVRVVGHMAGKDGGVEGSATAGGAPRAAGGVPATGMLAYIDLGPYGLKGPAQEDLDRPSRLPGFDEKSLVSALGAGVVRGDGPNPPVAAMHAESERLALVLNRLSLNGMSDAPQFHALLAGRANTSPQQLVAALAAQGHTVTVADSRYFANFGHMHFGGHDVMMPFWVNPQIKVPGSERPLLVPVSHAEYEWFIRGPKINADVSFYFGIDGKAQFRTMDQLDQGWVMNRHAHEYHGADALEVTRLAGEVVQAYAHLHDAHPNIAFGGYYGFGVCQDVVSAIELKLTGKSTLFPNTADAAFFNDRRDAEVNDLIRRLPKDRSGRPPEVERIFGSLPVGDSDAELATIRIPGLGADLVAVHQAWTDGTLNRIRPRWEVWTRRLAAVLGLVLGFAVAWFVRQRSRR